MIILKVLTVIAAITVVIVVTIFSCILTDMLANTTHKKRIAKLNNTIAFLKDCREADARDYRAMYQRSLILDLKVNELEKENEELKKAFDKQTNVTNNYYVKCSIPNKDDATPPLTKK